MHISMGLEKAGSVMSGDPMTILCAELTYSISETKKRYLLYLVSLLPYEDGLSNKISNLIF